MSHPQLDQLLKEAGQVILGKEEIIKALISCMLANGHALIEDVPGVGKTTLVKYLAKSLGLDFRRIQGTSDLLPSDIVGVSIFNKDAQHFEFKKGPLFTQFLLVDEINRASPKTQSALLQAMEERHVSVDDKILELPEPFLVMATQNPREQIGTFPLPESQLDRFLMKLHIGHPAREQEDRILKGENLSVDQVDKAVFNYQEFLKLKQLMAEVHLSQSLYDYILDLLQASRDKQDLRDLGPRAGQDMVRCLKAWLVVHDRNHAYPDDVQYLSRLVWSHRLPLSEYASRQEELQLVQQLIESVPVP